MVRRIFRASAQGLPAGEIAEPLNREKIRGPRDDWWGASPRQDRSPHRVRP